MQQGDRRRVEAIGGDDVAGEGRSGERIVDGHEVVIDGGGGKIAVALGKGGDGGNALAAVAIAGVLQGEINEPLVIGDEFGNADRSADVERDGFALHIGLGDALAVEGEGRGVQDGVTGSDGQRSGIRGPHAPAIAEGGELAVEGTATAAASASACSTAATAAAASATTASTSAATAAASATTTAAASTTAGRSEAAAGIGAEPGGCARRAESAHAESIGAAGDTEAEVREAGVHDGAAGSTGTAGAARSAASGDAIQSLLIVGSLLQAAADAAADGQVVGIGYAEVGHLFGAGGGDFLRAGLSGGDVDVGEPGLAGLSVSAASAAVCAIASAAGSSLAAAGLRLLAGGRIRRRCRSGSGGRSGGLGSGGGARRRGFDWGGGRSGSGRRFGGFAIARHFQGPIAHRGFAAIDFRVQRPEAQHVDLNFPLAGREIQLVAAILVGIGDQLGATLAGGDGGAGNELIGGANGAAMLGGKETGAAGQAGEEEEKSHGDLCFNSPQRLI